MNTIKTYVKAILLPLLIGGIVGLIISPFVQNEAVKKPFLSPPDIVFPIVWVILYCLMGLSYGRLKNKGQTNPEINKIYYQQLVINNLWPIFFFVFQWRLFAFVWILLLDIAVYIMIKRFGENDKKAGLLQIPYFIWVLFATYLNFATYLLN